MLERQVERRLPHHKLKAYGVAIQLLEAVRVTRADKARVFAIARAEAGEAASAVEIAVAAGDADAASLDGVIAHADRFVAMMTGLIR